jgi:hypothetical protein
LNVTGAGSLATTIDCGGVGNVRALHTNDSVWMAGLTVTGCLVSIVVQDDVVGDDDFNPNVVETISCSGGAGSAVVWPKHLNGARAVFVDVVWVNNTLMVAVEGSGTVFVLVAVAVCGLEVVEVTSVLCCRRAHL